MRFAWTLCVKDLRQRLRDRTAVMVAVVVPLILSGIVGLALGSNEAGFQMRLGWVDLDRSDASEAFRGFLARPWIKDVILIEEAAGVEEAEALLQDDDLDAAVVLAPGFASARSNEAERPSFEVLASGRNPFATRMTVSLAERFLAEWAVSEGGIAAEEARSLPAVDLQPVGGELRPVDFYALSMTVLFLTFTVLSGVRAMQSEVDAGVLARLVASPASPRSILAGKLLALLLVGLLQMTVMIAATSLLFGTDWGKPLPVLALVATSVLMAIGLTSFFMSIARNAEQGAMLASISIFLLAIVGGQFMPPQGLPDAFEILQRLTPNGQAARGFVDVASAGEHGSIASIAEPLAFTAIVGLLGITVGARRAARALRGEIA